MCEEVFRILFCITSLVTSNVDYRTVQQNKAEDESARESSLRGKIIILVWSYQVGWFCDM